MNVRNRLISLASRMISLGLLATFFSFYVMGAGNPGAWICYYHVQSGIMLMGVFFLEIIANAIDLRHGTRGFPAGLYMPITLGVFFYAITSALLYFAILVPSHPEERRLAGHIYVTLLLILPVIDWLLFDEKGTLRWYFGFTFLAYPIFYAVFMLFRPYIFPNIALYSDGSAYPYWMLNPKDPLFPLYLGAWLVGLYALAMLLIFLNNLFGGKYRKRAIDLY